MSRKLIAYFSATGNTAKVAGNLSEAINADVFYIEPAVRYTDADLDWRNENSRSSLEMKDLSCRPEVALKRDNMDDYSTIFLGFPIWWYIAPTIVNTFLEGYDFTGKTIITFATSGGSGMGKTLEMLAPSCPGAKLNEGKIFGKDAGINELAEWAETLDM